MISVYRSAVLSAALVLGGAMAVPAQAQDCRSIADPAQRLACYDRQQGAPAATPTAPAPAAEPAQPEPNRTGLREAKAPKVPEAKAPKSGFRSTVVSISPLNFGLYELQLADGSVWSTTTSSGRRPVVGDVVNYRRSMLGAHYFDIKGQRPVSVRRER